MAHYWHRLTGLKQSRWTRSDHTEPIDVGRRIGMGAAQGLLAGVCGVAVMTLSEKVACLAGRSVPTPSGT